MDLLGYLSFGTAMAVLAAGAGAFGMVLRLAERRAVLASRLVWGVPIMAGLFVFFVAGKSWSKTDLRHSLFVDAMAKETLQALPPRAVVVCWSDRILCPLLYAQGALKLRPDVILLPSDFFAWPSLMERMRRRQPDLVFEPVRTDLPRSHFIRDSFRAFCRKSGRPVFSELDKNVIGWDSLWPAGYLLQYRKRTCNAGAARGVLGFINARFGGPADFYTRGFAARELFKWGAYLEQLGLPEGERLQDRAVRLDGDNPRLWVDLGKRHLFSGRFELAETCFKLALACDPYEGENYFLLAYTLDALGKGGEARTARAEGDWLTGNKLKPMGQEDEKTTR
jgi:hypothetical protein